MLTELSKGDIIVASCPLRIVSGRCVVEIPADHQLVVKNGVKYAVPRVDVDNLAKNTDT